jgi:hypothetical protein
MTATTTQHFDEPLTVSEAAAALGRSKSWVRDRIADGRLEVAIAKPVTRVTASSVARLGRRLRAAARPAPVPYLRLVVCNA